MLNKKTLRKFAAENPTPVIPSNHGLLHAEQVAYIIRTDIRIIDHRRMLVLYVYDREQAVGGISAPVWTMFQAGNDYITLEKQNDGSARWRKASFENLSRKYYIPTKCAFYAAKDEQRVCRFFCDTDHDGVAALIRAQNRILSRRRRKREQERDKVIRAWMKGLPALPHDLVTWAHRNVMPAYFFYDHAKRGRAVGVCSSCGEEATLTGVKLNAKGVCPHCGREITMKPKGRIGRLFDRETCQVIQRTKTGELVVLRIIKATCAYYGERPGTVVYENARQFLSVDQDGKVHCDRYYYSHGDGKWKQGDRPVMFPYQYNYAADVCGYVYSKNVPIASTPWQYCPIQQFFEHFKSPMVMYHFLFAYIEHPKLEHLVKVGFYNLASDLAYRDCYGLLDESQNRTHRILGVGAEDVDFLRNLDADRSALKIYQGYCERNLKDRQRLLIWQLEHKVTHDINPALEYISVHKFLRYLDTQFSFLKYRLTPYKTKRYSSMQALVTEYRDYLDMAQKLEYDMRNSFILFPKDLQKAHDMVAKRVKHKADVKLRRDFRAAIQSVSGHLDYERDGMRIVAPTCAEDIVAEGQKLHHCVGTYVDRVARKECLIVFLRRSEDVSTPFYTVEIRGPKITQVRGMSNGEPTAEVKDFVSHWTQDVLQFAAAAG